MSCSGITATNVGNMFVPGLLVMLFHHMEYRGGGAGGGLETTGKIHQIEVTENNPFYCSPVS